MDFELGVLKEIADYLARPMSWREWHPYVRSLLALVPGTDLPTLRAYYSGNVDQARWDALGLTDESRAEREILAAIQTRLSLRSV